MTGQRGRATGEAGRAKSNQPTLLTYRALWALFRLCTMSDCARGVRSVQDGKVGRILRTVSINLVKKRLP